MWPPEMAATEIINHIKTITPEPDQHISIQIRQWLQRGDEPAAVYNAYREHRPDIPVHTLRTAFDKEFADFARQIGMPPADKTAVFDRIDGDNTPKPAKASFAGPER